MPSKIVVSAATKEALIEACKKYWYSENITIVDKTFHNSKGEIVNAVYRIKRGRHQLTREF